MNSQSTNRNSNQPASNQYVISIMSRDRVGIVRDVSTRISALGGDIADLSQTVLRGYFTMILLATFPPQVSDQALRQALTESNQPGAIPLEVAILPIAEGLAPTEVPSSEDIYVLTATGPDQIGFVATVSTFCAENQINIGDLATLVSGRDYVMILQVDLSRAPSLGIVQRNIQHFIQQTGIQLVLQHDDIFKATHEIHMP